MSALISTHFYLKNICIEQKFTARRDCHFSYGGAITQTSRGEQANRSDLNKMFNDSSIKMSTGV